MIAPLLDGTSDMVIGSRYVDGGATPNWPVSRKIASKLASLPAFFFTDTADPMAGFFATSRQVLKNVRADIPGFKIGLELLATADEHFRVTEVPIVFQDRFEGFSKMNKTIIFEYFKQILQLSGIETQTYPFPRVLTLVIFGILVDSLFFNLLNRIYGDGVIWHLTSFATACLVTGYGALRFWIETTDTDKQWLARFGGFLYLFVLCASLKAGVYLFISISFATPLIGAYLSSSIVGNTLFVPLLIIFVFSGFAEIRGDVQRRLVVVSLIIFGIVFRFVYLGLPELMEQEAYYWNYSNHLDISYLDHPPMVATIIWLASLLFGVSEFGVRFGAFICWFVTAYFTFQLTLKLFDRTTALGSVLLLSWLPFYFGAGILMTPDAPLLACWSALLYFLYKALVEENTKSWFGVGVSLGLGLLSKYTIVLLGPGILLYLLFDKQARRWWLRPAPYGAVLIALLLFMPVVLWNYQHEWASFLFQGEQRVTGKTFFTSHRLAGYVTLILTPAGVLGLFFFLLQGNGFFKRQEDGKRAETAHRPGINRGYLFLLLMTLAPLLVFLLFSLNREVKLNWTGPLWLSVIPFLGWTVMSAPYEFRSSVLKIAHWLWRPTIVITTVGLALGLHYVTLGLPKIPHPPGPFLIGWEQFARDIDGIVSSVEAEEGVRPVVIGMDPYQISSGLAFYRTKNRLQDGVEDPFLPIRETLGWHFFGWNSLMYSYWSQPETHRGSNIVVVGSSRARTESPYFQKRVKRESDMFTLPARKNDQEVRQFYIKKLYDYRPRPFKLPPPKPFEQ